MSASPPESAADRRAPTSLPPHPPLTAYYADAASREAYVRRVFDDTAPDYERIERLMALGSGAWYRHQALQRAGLTAGAEVLDVGIGTGLVAREALALVGPQGRVVGVDPSPGMLGEVREPRLELLCGYAEALPRSDASCDFLSMGYALRHLGDVRAAFAEFHRVLRPGGRLLLLEITRPEQRWGRLLLRGYLRGVVPVLARLAGRRDASAELWRYYWDTIEACIPPSAVIEALRGAGFVDVRRHLELGLFSEYTARRLGASDARAGVAGNA